MKSSVKVFLSFLAIVVIYCAVTSFGGGSSASVEFGNKVMTLHGPQDYAYSLEYTQIKSMELIDLPEDLGTAISGDDALLLSWGERENERWGTYTLFISKKIENAIMITTVDDEILVYNYESEDANESMMNLISEMKARQEAAE